MSTLVPSSTSRHSGHLPVPVYPPRHHPSLSLSAQPLCYAVQAGKRKGNTMVGRYLAEAVAAVPHFTREDFDKMLADQQNDCTLVLFLSKLIQAHLALADKLGTMQLPLL